MHVCLHPAAGGAIASAGEDGQVKVWSKKGESRSTIAQTGVPVYALAWAADSEQVLFSSGGELVIRSLQSSSKEVRWKAHDATVLALDWSPISGFIVSGAEDCKYKVRCAAAAGAAQA
jgi:intraflagellar transport protein 80